MSLNVTDGTYFWHGRTETLERSLALRTKIFKKEPYSGPRKLHHRHSVIVFSGCCGLVRPEGALVPLHAWKLEKAVPHDILTIFMALCEVYEWTHPRVSKQGVGLTF